MLKKSSTHFAKTVLLFFVLAAPAYVNGQTNEGDEPSVISPKNAIALVPQYTFLKGIRVDYEHKLNSGKHWLVVAPQFYLDVSNNYYDYNNFYTDYETMAGFGVNMYYKTVLFKSNHKNIDSGLPRHSLYLSAGPNFQHFSLTNTEEVIEPYIENGITYYRYNQQKVHKPINRFGAVANAGWQLAFGRFLFDMYLGIAIKYSVNGSGDLIEAPNANWIDLDYSGVLLDGGVRVGLFF